MKVKLLALAGMILLLTYCQPSPDESSDEATIAEDPDDGELRIISLSGFLTELLFDLELGGQIVGTDVTSTYPESVHQLPKLGHISQLNAEGILSLDPDILFVEEGQMGQSEIFRQLESSSIRIVPIKTRYTIMNAAGAARQINRFVNVDSTLIAELEEELRSDSLALNEFLVNEVDKPSVLFIYARGGGNLMVAGRNTSAEAIIMKAGGKNAISSFDNFRALSPEALLEASPEVILMFDSGLKSLNGKEGLSQVPGIDRTPAFRNGRIIAMDGQYLTGFGPRAGKAALELAEKINSSKL